MATVNMDSIQFYQPPSTNSLLSGKCTGLQKGSQVIRSPDVMARDGGCAFRTHHNSDRGHNVAKEDFLPTVEEVLRPALRKEQLRREPANAEHTLQRTDQQSLDRSSSSMATIQSRFVEDLGSQGRAAPLSYKQAAS